VNGLATSTPGIAPRKRAGGPQFADRELVPLIGHDRVEWDMTLPGFGLRCLPSGRQTWIVFTRIKGGVRRISLGNRAVVTEHQARGAAQLLILEAKVRRDPLARKRDALAAPMCTAFADLYRRVGVLRWKLGTIKAYDSYWRTHLGPTFGRRFLDQIDEASVFEWFSGLSRKRPGAANRALDILRSMFATAEEWGTVPLHSNPCLAIKRNAGKVYRRYLTDEELARLGRSLDQLQADHPIQVGAVRMLIYTGCRKQEILKLRWTDITGRLMTLRDSKTGPRVVELGQAARDALALIPRRPGHPCLFPSPSRRRAPITELLPFWHKVVLPHARITPLRLHDLRHTFASHAAIEKENAAMIGKMLGHSGTDNVQRYMHLADQPALDAAELVSSVLWESLAQGRDRPIAANAKIAAARCQSAS
jgi:integrase